MKYIFFMLVGVVVILGGTIFFVNQAHPSREFSADITAMNKSSAMAVPVVTPTIEERIKEAQKRSSTIKGLYMTAEVANDGGAAATRLRNSIIHLAETTEINGIVIDVKEVCGLEYNRDRLKQLIAKLHDKHIWTIARIVTFKDASQIETHPGWYLTRTMPKTVFDQCSNKLYLRTKNPDEKKSGVMLWRDDKGGYWLDPASIDVYNYIADIGKKIIDLGFDELQFDYIRFPSDGDVNRAVFPVWDKKIPKFTVLKSFFAFLHDSLKQYKPEIILSADMFGYAAIRAGDVGIGQRLEDIGSSFDYVSFMVYPSHYYSGLNLPFDPIHNFSAINYDRKQVRIHPDITVARSLQIAQDFLDSLIASSSATTTIGTSIGGDQPRNTQTYTEPNVKLRPWLEDFFHEADKEAGRPYGAEKVRMQINGAEHVAASGWLLWNAANVYTEGALKPKELQ